MTNRKYLIAIGVVAATAIAAGCGGSDSDSQGTTPGSSGAGATSSVAPSDGIVAGSVLNIGYSTEPATLDWQNHGDPGAELALWRLNEPLVELRSDGSFTPVLATEVPVHDEADPLRWHVTLREGITFTDGTAFDAEAVKANVDRVSNPEFETVTSGYEQLAGAEVVSPTEVDILTKEPDPVFLFRLPELRMISPKALEDPSYGQSPVGTGPYMFDKWEKGTEIVLKANPDYWGTPGTIETVNIRFIDDESTLMSALKTGEIDLAPIAPDQSGDVPQVLRSGSVTESGAIRFNLSKAPYDDVNFRQALNYAVDKDAINDAIFGGQFEVSQCQSMPADAFGFNPDLAPYAFDPDKAKELLAKVDLPAGFAVEMDGTSGFWTRDREVNEAIASYWRDLGLDVNLVIDDSDTYIDKLTSGADSPGIMYMELDHRYYHGARIVDRMFNRTGSISTIGNQLPEVDQLLKDAATFDEAASKAAYQEMFKTGCDAAVYVFTLNRFDLWGASTKVTYTPGRGGLQRLNLDEVRLG